MSDNSEIGRVLRASTAGFAVGCRVTQLRIPSFGGLVQALPVDGRFPVYGLIYDIHIDDDPVVQRLVLAENPPTEVIEDQRQNRLRPIEMSVLAVGYGENGRIVHGMPPRPPLNLDPVNICKDQDTVCQFTDKLTYLRLILRAQSQRVPVDQLLVAHIRHTYQLRGDDAVWAMRVIQEVIELLRSNYDVLIPTLEALSDALPELALGELL
jgi:hypothetical protein